MRSDLEMLIDTCVFLWAVREPHKLSKQVAKLIETRAKGSNIFLSPVSVQEVIFKAPKLGLDNPARWIDKHFRALGLQWLPIYGEHAFELADLPWIHRDPFDRMLVAQSIADDIPIATPDEYIRQYPVKTIW